MKQQEENKNYCTLYLIRHGETEWNKNHIVMGQKDSPLTIEGIEQAQATANQFKDIHFDSIFSSDSLRAQKTAEIIKLERQLAIETSKLLRERSYGHFEGKPVQEYKEAIKHLLEKAKQLPEKEQWKFKFGEDIESDEELVSRFIIQLREIAVAYPNKNVLVATHGGCIRMFLIHMGHFKYGELPAGSFQNGGYVKVLSDGVDFFIKDIKGIVKPKKS
jgi:broad specificity phosphatase PhoE